MSARASAASATSSKSKANAHLSLTSKPFRPFPIGTTKIYVPTALDHNESVEERSICYHLFVSAIEKLQGVVTYEEMIHTLGALCNMSVVSMSHTQRFISRLEREWKIPANYECLSWHTFDGTVANATILNGANANDRNVLMPLGDMVNNLAAPNMRPINVKYVRVRQTINFDDIASPSSRPCRLEIEHFIELPQTQYQALNGNGLPIRRSTFTGPADIRTMTPDDFMQQVLNPTGQSRSGIGLLSQPGFGIVEARLDFSHFDVVREECRRLAWPTIKDKVFHAVAPGLVNRPSSYLEDLKMVTADSNGNSVTLSVQQYSSRAYVAIQPFSEQETWPICAIATIVQNLDPDLRDSLEADGYKKHRQTLSRHRDAQMDLMGELFERLTKVEESQKRLHRTIHRQYHVALHTDVPESPSTITDDAASAKTLQSLDEQTLTEYCQPTAGWDFGRCFGCLGEGCSWSNCPKRNDRVCQERAKVNLKYFGVNRKNKKRKRVKGSPTWSDHDKKAKSSLIADFASNPSTFQAITKAVEAKKKKGKRSVKEEDDDDDPGAGTMSFMYDVVPVPCLNASPTSPGVLPIAIDRELPHIALDIGPLHWTRDTDVPTLLGIIDTGAALSTGNLDYFSTIVSVFPECVEEILIADGANGSYLPVTLSGVVRDHATAMTTTQLPVMYKLKLRRKTADGKSATLSVACGKSVACNFIIGNSFLKQAQASINYASDCLDCPVFEDGGFPLKYMAPRLHIPDKTRYPLPEKTRVNFGQVLELVDSIYALVYGADTPVADPQGDSSPHVPFTIDRTGVVPTPTPSINDGWYCQAQGLPPPIAGANNNTSAFISAARPTPPPPDFIPSSPQQGTARATSSTALLHGQNTLNAGHRARVQFSLAASAAGALGEQHADFGSALLGDEGQPELSPKAEPIRAAKRRRGSKKAKRPHPMLDDRGHPDIQSEWEAMLPDVLGNVVRKRRHPAPNITDVDPAFNRMFDEAKDGEFLNSQLKTDHLSPTQAQQLKDVIKAHWPVFAPEGLLVPVRDYECVIDTGNHPPVACKNPTYGPLETPKIEEAIAGLLKLNQIKQIHDGAWLSKGLLAPKPHQEHVTDIDQFIWRFCVNYIPLNAITRIIAFPIPRCDDAVGIDFGGSRWKWLMDAPSGYHQIRVAESSQPKLAFAGTRGSKYTYLVMPFGPVNGPVTFIVMIHDLDDTWESVAKSRGITINESCNTRIIVDDIFSWAKTFEQALHYLECQLKVCRSQNLSLSLKKSLFFPDRIEFVGHDVCDDGNRPAQSKHALLKSWPPFKIVRDIAAFVGFVNFYAPYIPNAELCMVNLRELIKLDMDTDVTTLLTPDHERERQDLIQALLRDPCLARWDPLKRCYVRTDFSSHGMGFVLLQPDNHDPSLAAMRREMAGGPCKFMLPKSELRLRPVSFGARKTRGKESKLHSYLGEAFAGDWALFKCQAKLWGQRFTWITDCYALRFVMTYDGSNPVVQRIQMRFMLWAMDIVHRRNDHLIDADYFSRCGSDLYFDPLVSEYLNFTTELRKLYPPPTGPMLPENMPGYRGPRFNPSNAGLKKPATTSDTAPAAITLTSIQAFATECDDPAIAPILQAIYLEDSGGATHCLQNVPIQFGFLKPNFALTAVSQQYQDSVPALASELSSFAWAVYGFNSGHFHATCASRRIPFDIVLAADTRQAGRALFKALTTCPSISESSDALLRVVKTATSTATIHGYFIHTHRFLSPITEQRFWRSQAAIARELSARRHLQVIVVSIVEEIDMSHVTSFRRSLERQSWTFTLHDIYYPDFGDSIASSCSLLIGINKRCSADHSPFSVPQPPQVDPRRLGEFIYAPFNVAEYGVSPARHTAAINDSDMTVSMPLPEPIGARSIRSKRIYNLHRSIDDASITAGSGVYSLDGLCPTYSSPNSNIFSTLFGVEFTSGHDHLVRPISPYEFACCYQLGNELTSRLSHPQNQLLLDCGIPGRTSNWILEALHRRLSGIRDENFEAIQPVDSPAAAPAAMCSVPSFLSGAIGSRLPDHETWVKAVADDPETALIRKLVLNPGLLQGIDGRDLLNKVHFVYRQPLRDSRIHLKNGVLFLHQPLRHDTKYISKKLVPASLRNIIFVAFHTNPIGAHMDAARTYMRIRMRFFWPDMFKYIKRLTRACPGCRLGHISNSPSADLVYSFPMDAPMMVLHIDIYQASANYNFDGNKYYLIACCGMTAFAVCEPTREANAKEFASAIMKIWLRFGFSHTIVIDKDSKFRNTFADTAELLCINMHVLSGENHNPMLVERVNRFINAALTIFCEERGSVTVSQEAILMSIYAWNSAPVVGTDISRSLVVTGREFHFPIDFSADKHRFLSSTPARVSSFAGQQAKLLSACRQVAEELVSHHRAYHREYLNSKRPCPRIYSPGDRVFARRAVRSDASKGHVGKLLSAYTGPWEVIKREKGTSYSLRHAITKRDGKRHAAHMSPFPDELIPFEPVDGPDNRYGQLNRPIQADPYKNAGIKGFLPSEPYKEPADAASLTTTTTSTPAFHFPSLSELNAELKDWEQSDIDAALKDDTLCTPFEVFASDIDPLPEVEPTAPLAPTAAAPRPAIPSIADLSTALIACTHKLFLVAHRVPSLSLCEWALVRVNLKASLSLHPSALQDGKFLCEFYICHPADVYFNGANQRYWLEYHPSCENLDSSHKNTAHLIRPSQQSEAYATAEGLKPLSRWLRLTNADTYISGPFDFAIINGIQSKDRIPEEHLRRLLAYNATFSNNLPSLDLPNYSAHLSVFHSTTDSPCISARVKACDLPPPA